MQAAELASRAGQIKWWHGMELGQGVATAGGYRPADALQRIGIPDRLDGKSVLDIGAWDGFYSFECERRGAHRIAACDYFCWHSATGGKDGFNLAREALGSRVEDLDVDVPDIHPGSVGGQFDLVLFLGVLYHLRDPLGALERVASVAKDMVIVESHVDMLHVPTPAMAFYPGAEINNDPTNWFGPNPAAIVAMLGAVGFARTHVHAVVPIGYPAGANCGRATIHAWK